jgi:hypothetical protein
VAGQDGQEANGDRRKATGKQGHTTGPSRYGRTLYNWSHTSPRGWARKGADVSRAAR